MGPEHDARMPLTAHLEELRWRIVRALLAIAIAFLVCYWFADALVAFLFRPLSELRPNQPAAYGVGLTEAFFTKLKVSFVAGLFVASPVVFFQAWRFVAPGLYATEKRMALPFATAASMFFTLGAAFCYRLVFPTAFRFFLEEFSSVHAEAIPTMSEYLNFTSRMLLAFGVTFELPVVTFFLARLGVVTHRTLLSMGRYAIVVIFIVAAVLTPGPDVASQLLMAAPLLVLYGLSIGVAWAAARPAAAPVPAEETGQP
ncbi:MAG: twin-arginine translocase subunit TatC [Deltaproteobacteria bacterium]|nr:MAG: twin-arginine translocase subunit TatC [Deltaproteobacteria bacterium]TMA54297.1 MAG: twin-arginine translocase subunit TatC [Deltaproteobacteria bacterium]